MTKKILIAPDKFKGSLSASEICRILKAEIESELPDVIIESCPLADGGDGSLEVLSSYLKLKKQHCTTVDPLGKPIESTYYTLENKAFIELASASGLVLLNELDRNPMHTSTYGTGLQIVDALNLGVEEIFLFLGGSATNDGGIGIANALGFSFFDKDGNELKPNGASLRSIAKIFPPKIQTTFKKIILCCDVENPPFGMNGAAYIYAKQKGANEEEIEKLDAGLVNLCNQLEKYNGINLSRLVGGGAAGGVAISLTALFGADLEGGMTFISEVTQLEQKIKNSDLVISGEGRLDSQSLEGKVVSGVADICRKYNKDLWLVVGKNELSHDQIEMLEIDKIFAIMDLAKEESDAIRMASQYLEEIGNEMVKHLENWEE